MKKRFFRNIPVLIITCCCLLIIACENDVSKIPNYRKKQIGVEEGKNIESYYSENSKVKAKLTAPVMNRYQTDSPYYEFPKTLHVDFFNDSMKVESKLDALYGKYRQNESKVFLRDSVVVKNILKGDTLHCDELWWDQNTQKFYTDKPVRINTKDKILFGKGLEAAQNFTWYVIKQPTGIVMTSDTSYTR